MFKFLKKDKEKKKTEATKEKAVAEEKAEKVEEEEKTEIVVEGEESVESSNAEKRAIKAVYRVIYDSEWMVKKDGAQRVIRRVRTKAEALELANQFATRQDLSISVQKKDGKFQKKSSYKTMMSSDKADK